MPNIFSPWIMPFLLLLCFVLIAVLWAISANLKGKLQTALSLIKDLHSLNTKQASRIDALESSFIQTKKHIDSVRADTNTQLTQSETRIDKIQAMVERIEEQDPSLKMYSRASKLVAQGASIEDVIEASGLPRAEVEVLISLQAK